MSAGLAALLYALRPGRGGPAHASIIAWILGIGVTLAVSVVFAVIGFRSAGARRAVFLGLATGVGFALTAVLLTGVSAAYSTSGVGGVLTSWQTYLLIVLGPGFLFLQKSLQAGSLVAAQPALTLSNPVVAVVFGVVVFGEHVRTDGCWHSPSRERRPSPRALWCWPDLHSCTAVRTRDDSPVRRWRVWRAAAAHAGAPRCSGGRGRSRARRGRPPSGWRPTPRAGLPRTVWTSGGCACPGLHRPRR